MAGKRTGNDSCGNARGLLRTGGHGAAREKKGFKLITSRVVGEGQNSSVSAIDNRRTRQKGTNLGGRKKAQHEGGGGKGIGHPKAKKNQLANSDHDGVVPLSRQIRSQ